MKSVIILANGSSSRYGQDKLSLDIMGRTVLQRTADTFASVADEIIIVTDNSKIAELFPFAKVVSGGQTRTQSVMCGLKNVHKDSKLVAIHDGARPFVGLPLIEQLFIEAQKKGSAVPSLAVTDTIYYNSEQGLVVADREKLRSVQTPQVFDTQKIKQAYCLIGNKLFTDDSQVYYNCFGDINLIEGQSTNKKLTFSGDLPVYKSGVGYDVHQLTYGDMLILGGVKIPFNKKLLGHSDADVLLHAVMDALLGATHNKDIGHCFPDTDMKYKGADSMQLMSQVYELIKSQGYTVVNVSATIMAQAPKLSPFKQQFEHNIAQCLKVAPCNVNVGATTTEELGIIGEGNGIACYATCVVMK